MVAAFLRRDVEGATESFADDYVGMFHGQPNVVGKAAEVEVTTAQIADPALGLSLSDVEVDVAKAGDMAVYTSTYAYDFTDPESMTPTTEVGNWVLIYKRQADGTMKVTKGIVTDTPSG
jgi:ketosteroid isomerase-like protein